MFSTKNENFLLSLLFLKHLRHLRTFSLVLATFIKISSFSILHFQMYINSLNGKYYTVIEFNEVDVRIYLPKKVIIHRGR